MSEKITRSGTETQLLAAESGLVLLHGASRVRYPAVTQDLVRTPFAAL
jgi:hypothetical protein